MEEDVTGVSCAEAEDAAKRAMMLRIGPTTKDFSATDVNSAKTEEPRYRVGSWGLEPSNHLCYIAELDS